MSLDETAMEAVVDEVGALLDASIGLRPQSTLRGRLRRCVRDEAVADGDDLESYLRKLSHSGDLMQRLVNRVTVQETAFFRHPDHFVVLANDVLPGLQPPVRIWSAGCANGQEAYSLAMLLEEQSVSGSILATDLSTSALARTTEGRYNEREITGVSAMRRARHLTPAGDKWVVGPALRRRVATMRHNLLNALPAPVSAGACQVVFCRNVLIYFSPEHTKAFLDKIAAAVAPGAYLFLGAAESLWQVTDGFEAVRLGESFVYRRREPARPGPRRPEAAPASLPALRRQPRVVDRTRPRRATGLPQVVADAPSSTETDVLAGAGRRALEAGDSATAVVAFRKWAYLAPDDPLALLHLALALEAGGHLVSAQRAFGVARAATLRGGSAIEATALGGYAPDELMRLLDSKQVRSS
jgi:chemotaxis methyl-accepting protein methylase